MAELIDSVDGVVAPDRRRIMIFGPTGDWQVHSGPDGDRLCFAGPDELLLMSGSNWFHSVPVVLEAWSGEPPVDAAAERSETTEMLLRVGTVELTASGERPRSDVLTVGPPGRYCVRVDVSGWAEAQRFHPSDERPQMAEGVERFWVRWWLLEAV